MLPSKLDQKKVPPETGSEAEFGFRRALIPSRLGMLAKSLQCNSAGFMYLI